MTPLRLIIFVSLISALMAAGCSRRYEEGPDISFLTPAQRVQNTWEWAYFFREGVNLTGKMADSTITFAPGDSVLICGPGEGCRIGRWNLIDKRRKLQLIFGREAIAYHIRFLTRNDLWLRYSDTLLIEWELRAVR